MIPAALEALLRVALPPLKLALRERYPWDVPRGSRKEAGRACRVITGRRAPSP
jgi:hypothetical protein